MRKIAFTYNADRMARKVIEQLFKSKGLVFDFEESGSVSMKSDLDGEGLQDLQRQLTEYGIVLSAKTDDDLVSRIKLILVQSVNSKEFRAKKVSALLSDELGYSYAYLSNLFSKTTYTSIENFLILVRIEKAKELLMHQQMSLTEAAHELDYSSVAHLSSQFKNVTGLTVSQFLKLVKTRNN